MPTVTTPKPSAAERRAALERDKAALATHLATVRAERDSLPPSDPTWRRKNAEMRDVADELAGYDDAIAALAPEVEAEIREAGHAARVARHHAATEAAKKADAIPARIDHHLSTMIALVGQYLEWVPRCASAAGVEPHPYRLNEVVPEMEHVCTIILARLVAAGILDREHLPALYEDAPSTFEDLRAAGMASPGQRPPHPLEMAARARVAGVHEAFKRAIAAADPDRQRREAERLADIARQRAEREAAEAAQPRRIGDNPPPIVHQAPAVVR